MARKKKTAENTAVAPVTTTPAANEHPGWNPPRQPLQLAAPASEQAVPAQPNTPPQLPPPASVQPEITYEEVSNAPRPTGRVTGYGSNVAIFLERYHHLEDEKAALDEGKTWFRKVARQFQQAHGTETVVFATNGAGSVDVVFTKNRCKLDKGLVAEAAANPTVASLLTSAETLSGEAWTWLLDTAQVPTQDGTGWMSLRQAISMGLNFKVNQETRLHPDYVETLGNLRRLNALTPEAESLVEKLLAAGLNEPSVKIGG